MQNGLCEASCRLALAFSGCRSALPVEQLIVQATTQCKADRHNILFLSCLPLAYLSFPQRLCPAPSYMVDILHIRVERQHCSAALLI